MYFWYVCRKAIPAALRVFSLAHLIRPVVRNLHNTYPVRVRVDDVLELCFRAQEGLDGLREIRAGGHTRFVGALYP